MRIGTDVSIQECRDSGYLVMDYKVRELFPNGKNNPMDKDCAVRFTASIPADNRIGYVGEKIIYLDTLLSWDALEEMYTSRMDSINSLMGGIHFNIDNPDAFDLLSLADAVNAYMGLE